MFELAKPFGASGKLADDLAGPFATQYASGVLDATDVSRAIIRHVLYFV